MSWRVLVFNIYNFAFYVANEHIFSENDVANVLKRFVRQLDEPLLTAQLRDGFLRIANIEQVGLISFFCYYEFLKMCSISRLITCFAIMLNLYPVDAFIF